MRAGRMNRRVTIRRRAVVAGNPGGVPRGDFADVFSVWGEVKQAIASQQVEAGFSGDPITAIIRVYDSAQARTISANDRLAIAGMPGVGSGEDFAIDSVALPELARRTIDLRIVRKMV